MLRTDEGQGVVMTARYLRTLVGADVANDLGRRFRDEEILEVWCSPDEGLVIATEPKLGEWPFIAVPLDVKA
jgi:hypothetical protein